MSGAVAYGLIEDNEITDNNGGKFQLVLRLATSKDNMDIKNSVITFLNISERTWNKYLRNKEILYNYILPFSHKERALWLASPSSNISRVSPVIPSARG